MSFERKKIRSLGLGSHILGSVVEYDNSRREDPSGGWKLTASIVLVSAVMVSFFSARGCFRRDPEPIKTPEPPPIVVTVQSNAAVAVAATNVLDRTKSPHPSAQAAAAGAGATWVTGAGMRPPRERALLERLDDAERLGRVAIAINTIEQLRARPAMADLDDKLARRLGDLNIKRLFSGESVPWVAETTVQRGQTVHRIAREHGTTVAAVRQLNRLSQREELSVGRKLRVLDFPKAALVVHKQTRFADLTLGGRFFKRYYLSAGHATRPGAYPITSRPEEGPRSRFAALGIRVAPADMLELDMFMAPGSMLTVSEM